MQQRLETQGSIYTVKKSHDFVRSEGCGRHEENLELNMANLKHKTFGTGVQHFTS
jgi:hypothetical protein